MNDLLKSEGVCLSAEQLDALAAPTSDPNLTAAYRRHVLQCPRCAAELDLLRSFQEAKADPEEEADLSWIESRSQPQPAPVPRFPPPPPKWWSRLPLFSRWAAAVATGLLVIAGALQLQQLRMASTRVEEAGSPGAQRSGSIAVVEPTGGVNTVPTRFEWSPVAQASAYQVSLEEVDGTVLWTGTSQGTRIEIPSSIGARIVPRKTLLWEVQALSSDGQVIAESERTRFVLRAQD